MPKHIERWSFVLSVISGIVAAIAGGSGWAISSVVAGCLAAAAPIAGRYASHALAAAAETAANKKISSAEQRATDATIQLEVMRNRLAPRRLTDAQIKSLLYDMSNIPTINIGVNFNRHEAEPQTLHSQIYDTLKQSGHNARWFGGMNNNTSGIEVTGIHNEEKVYVMASLSRAGIPFRNVIHTDDPEGKRGVEIWVGAHPGLSG